LARSIKFFFANRTSVYKQYEEFFEYDTEDKQDGDEGVDDTPKMDKGQVTARFYFTLTYQLASEDITKFEQIENIPLYLALTTAAYKKERYLKQKEEADKLRKQMKKV
jgi:hypothetical protein